MSERVFLGQGYKIMTLTYRETNTSELRHLMLPNDLEGEQFVRLKMLKERLGLNEIFYLNTCNRVLFMFHTELNLDLKFQRNLLEQINPALTEEEVQNLSKHIRVIEGENALNHLFEVASSVDSMVVGEREILGQLRKAYDECALQGLSGDFIRLAIQHAVRTAKNVYSNTKIGEKPVSVVSLAIKAMMEKQPNKDARILLLGAGQTINLVCEFLFKLDFNNVTIFNRSLDKAENLAKRFQNGSAHALGELERFSNGFDVLISCTGHSQSWIDSAIFQTLLNKESKNKIVIDLAVPGNVKKEVIENTPDTVSYIDVEQLKEIAQLNLSYRQQEVANAKEIILEELDAFYHLLNFRRIEKTFEEVPVKIKEIKSKALNQVFQKDLETVDEQTQELIHRMMDYMEKKCISVPMIAAKRLAAKA